MNYKIISTSELYQILETATDQVIESFPTKEEARKMLRHFNLGGGFDGYTPTFMVKNCSKLLQKLESAYK